MSSSLSCALEPSRSRMFSPVPVSKAVYVLPSPRHIMYFCSVQWCPVRCQIAQTLSPLTFLDIPAALSELSLLFSLKSLYTQPASSCLSGCTFSDYFVAPPRPFQGSLSYSTLCSIPLNLNTSSVMLIPQWITLQRILFCAVYSAIWLLT